MKLRDYQVDAIVNIFQLFNIKPAGPDDEPIVQRYNEKCASGSSYGHGEDCSHVGDDKALAAGPDNDDITPF